MNITSKHTMCDVKRCRRSIYLGYEAFINVRRSVNVCEFHWKKHCDDDDKFDLRTHFEPNKNMK